MVVAIENSIHSTERYKHLYVLQGVDVCMLASKYYPSHTHTHIITLHALWSLHVLFLLAQDPVSQPVHQPSVNPVQGAVLQTVC